MPTLRREDGAQFVVQSYREVLLAKKCAARKKELRDLAKSHGEYVRIFKHNANGVGNVVVLEAILSREPGYLLGETVWYHFNKPQNMIFCEALTEKQHALVVIVRDGIIYLDAKLPYASLLDELTALGFTQKKYVIYVYGDVPLGEKKSLDCFAFEPTQVAAFNRLATPVFSKLELNTALQLQPLELALTSPEFSRALALPLAIGAIVVLALFFGWKFYHQPVAMPKPRVEDPYEYYYNALQSANPALVIKELIYNVSMLYGLPGWEVANITYKDKAYTFRLVPSIGKGTQLEEWARINNFYNIQINQMDAKLQFESKLFYRDRPKYIYNLHRTVNLFVDKLDDILTRDNIGVASAVKSRSAQYTNVTVSFSDLSPAGLMVLGSVLEGVPLQLNSININVHNNLFSGNVVVAVWGN